MLTRLALVAAGASTASIASDHFFSRTVSNAKDEKDGPKTKAAVQEQEQNGQNVSRHRAALTLGSIAKKLWATKNVCVWNLNHVSCDGATQKIDTPVEEEEDEESSFPNLSRHGSDSLLAKYLTREIYDQLKDKKTRMGVTLEDTIRAGTTLPWGANPPRGIAGVYAGDAESYEVFRPLFDPLILERHHVDAQRKLTRNKQRVSPGQRTLQRHRTNLNPQFLVEQRLDPDGEYVLYTRMRLARSLEGFRFSPCITRAERRKIEQILSDCCSDWKEGSYMPLMEMTNEMHDDLIQRR